MPDEKDFDDMSEDELARARGDFFGDDVPPVFEVVEDKPEDEETVAEGSETESEAAGSDEEAGADDGAAGADDGAAGADDGAAEEGSAEDSGDGAEAGSEDSDEAPAPVAEEPKKEGPPAKGQWVPRARLNTKNEKIKAAEARIKELEAQVAANQPEAEPAADYDAMLAESNKALTAALKDGETDKVAELMVSIQQQQNDKFEARLAAQSAAQTAEQLAQRAYDEAAASLSTTYEVYDVNSPNFNQGLVDGVMRVAQSFEAAGKAPAAALLEAAGLFESVAGLPLGSQEIDGTVITTNPPKHVRRTTDIKKNVAAAKRQPASLNGTGTNSDKLGQKTGKFDVMAMSDADFDKLDAATLAQMRGDFLGS